MIRCTVLVENTACACGFEAEHGLSLLLETERERWLFDLGQGSRFLKNAALLKVDLRSLTGVVISHGHYDHGGGLEAYLSYDVEQTPIYLSEHAFDRYFNGQQKAIGLDCQFEHHPQLHRLSQTTQLSKEAMLIQLPMHEDVIPRQSYGLTRQEGDTFVVDDFRHEMALLLTVGDKRVLVSGCAHCGILNWLASVQPDVFIGGFHLGKVNLTDPNDRAMLEMIATRLAAAPINYYTGHCTGDAPYAFLKERLGPRLHALSTGAVFNILTVSTETETREGNV